MKEKILPFIKKYPISIFLSIIALQLVSISGKLDQSGRLDGDLRACLKWQTSFLKGTLKQSKNNKKSAAKKIGIPYDSVFTYCKLLTKNNM